MTVRTEADLPGLVPTPGRPFGIYIHVPFCATRCGYCDFNTYTPAELGGANPDGWLVALRAELRTGQPSCLARRLTCRRCSSAAERRRYWAARA